MRNTFHLIPIATMRLLSIVAIGAGACTSHYGAEANNGPQDEPRSPKVTVATRPRPDLSGRTRFGDASFYARKFAGREMADGARMDPHGDTASETLPLGTRAKVTNIETGQSAVVTIQDRGPYVKGRIVDLSPSTAERIGITQDKGIAKVKVSPLSVPQPDGSTKPRIETPDSKHLR